MEPLLELINTYGLPLVFLIAIVLFLKPYAKKALDIVFDKQIPMAEKMKVDYVMRKLIAYDTKIIITLTEAAHELGADHITLLQFHNGNRTHLGVPFTFITATHYFSDGGAENPYLKIDRMPISIIANFLQLLLREKIAQTGLQPNCPFKNIGSMAGVYHSYMIPVYDELDRFIAILLVSYNWEYELTGDDREKLERFGQRVAVNLCVYAEIDAAFEKNHPHLK